MNAIVFRPWTGCSREQNLLALDEYRVLRSKRVFPIVLSFRASQHLDSPGYARFAPEGCVMQEKSFPSRNYSDQIRQTINTLPVLVMLSLRPSRLGCIRGDLASHFGRERF